MGSSADKAGAAWYCQTGWVGRARSDGIRPEPVVKLRERGTGSNLADMGRDAVHDRPVWMVDSVGRRGCRKGLMFARLATSTRPALVNGAVGAVSSQDGRLTAVLRFIVAHQKIAAIDILADPSGWATSPDTPYR